MEIHEGDWKIVHYKETAQRVKKTTENAVWLKNWSLHVYKQKSESYRHEEE